MSEAVQVTPEAITAFDGDKQLDISVKGDRVTFRMWRRNDFDRSFSITPSTLGFLLGALMRVLDPQNLAGMRRPGALDAFPTDGHPEHLQIFDQHNKFQGVAYMLPDREGHETPSVEQRLHDDLMCVLSLIDGAPEAAEAWQRVNAFIEAQIGVGIRREQRLKDLELVATALLPWCDEYEVEARAARKVLGTQDAKTKQALNLEEALTEIADRP